MSDNSGQHSQESLEMREYWAELQRRRLTDKIMRKMISLDSITDKLFENIEGIESLSLLNDTLDCIDKTFDIIEYLKEKYNADRRIGPSKD